MAGGKGKVTGARTREDPPDIDDPGLVVRPIGGGPGGVVVVEEIPSKTSGVTAIPVSAAPVPLLVASATRLGWSVRNTSTIDTLFVLASASGVVSPTFHTVALRPGAYYEDPYHYTGDVFGIWDAATNGEALVDDYQP